MTAALWLPYVEMLFLPSLYTHPPHSSFTSLIFIYNRTKTDSSELRWNSSIEASDVLMLNSWFQAKQIIAIPQPDASSFSPSSEIENNTLQKIAVVVTEQQVRFSSVCVVLVLTVFIACDALTFVHSIVSFPFSCSCISFFSY
jgi:hypothetical protein